MKRNKIRVFSLLFVVFIALAATPQITSLPTGVGTLGNPGCSCHSGGAGTTAIDVFGMPDSFTAGESYELKISISNPAIPGGELTSNMGGFRLIASAGTFGPGENFTDLVQVLEGGATHTELGNDVRDWNVTWTAPDSEGQIVEFTLHGNAVNGNAVGEGNGNTGDAWATYTTSVSYTHLTLPTKRIV